MSKYKIGKNIERLSHRLDDVERILEEIQAGDTPFGNYSASLAPVVNVGRTGLQNSKEITLTTYARSESWPPMHGVPAGSNDFDFVWTKDTFLLWSGSTGVWQYDPKRMATGPTGENRPAPNGYYCAGLNVGALCAMYTVRDSFFMMQYRPEFDDTSSEYSMVYVNNHNVDIKIKFWINDKLGQRGRTGYYADNRGELNYKVKIVKKP